MAEKDTAKQALQSALESAGFCIWPVNERGNAYKFGLLWGVTLSWPGPDETIKEEIEKAYDITRKIAEEWHLKPCLENPHMATGGALIVYCGFQTLLLEAAEKKARKQNKTLFQVMDEDEELKKMAQGELQFVAL